MGRMPAESPNHRQRNYARQSDDIEATVAELNAKGVRFEHYGFPGQDESGTWAAPSGDKVAWFKDPDGNTLSISQHG
jgi:hypothetical protein